MSPRRTTIAEVNNIGANETISIVDEFTFTVDATASCRTLLAFDVCFYDSDDELVSTVRVPVFVKSSDVQVASIIIENDDNGNGILEEGETADSLAAKIHKLEYQHYPVVIEELIRS